MNTSLTQYTAEFGERKVKCGESGRRIGKGNAFDKWSAAESWGKSAESASDGDDLPESEGEKDQETEEEGNFFEFPCHHVGARGEMIGYDQEQQQREEQLETGEEQRSSGLWHPVVGLSVRSEVRGSSQRLTVPSSG